MSFGSREIIGTLFALIIFACLLGFISPPLALSLGLFFGLALGSPELPLSKFSKILLQVSVVGLGFGMDLGSVIEAGKMGFWMTTCIIFGSLLVGSLLGSLLKVDKETSLLVSVGTSICGGSAIAAIGAAIGASSAAMSVSLITVFLLNSLALLIFPPIGHWLDMTEQQFGLWSAIAIHDTSSVVGAAAKFGDVALKTATTVKLSRSLWILPLAICLGRSINFRGNAKLVFPWFVLGFLFAAGLRSYVPQFVSYYDLIKYFSKSCLTVTLFLIGSSLSLSSIKTIGLKPLLQGVILWIFVSIIGVLAALQT